MPAPCTRYPVVASMATRACLSSAARNQAKVESDPKLASPKGSNPFHGAVAPGMPSRVTESAVTEDPYKDKQTDRWDTVFVVALHDNIKFCCQIWWTNIDISITSKTDKHTFVLAGAKAVAEPARARRVAAIFMVSLNIKLINVPSWGVKQFSHIKTKTCQIKLWARSNLSTSTWNHDFPGMWFSRFRGLGDEGAPT